MKENMLKLSENYDVVSLDVFDTAIFRLCERPTDLFRKIIIKQNDGNINFHSIRIKMEADAAKDLTGDMAACITLDKIYSQMPREFSSKLENLRRAEIKLEEQFTYANPEILGIYNYLRKNNRKVIFLSDMYLPVEVIRNLLAKSDYLGELEIHVSAEIGLSKHTGSIYKLIKSQYGSKIMHIGDNYTSDYTNAIKGEMDAIYYQTKKSISARIVNYIKYISYKPIYI